MSFSVEDVTFAGASIPSCKSSNADLPSSSSPPPFLPPSPLPHPLVELGDDPQFGLQVTPSFLCSDVPQDVLVPHTWSKEHVSLVLPRLLILSGGGRGGGG